MTKAHEGKQIAAIPGGSYDGQVVAQQTVDPATGQTVTQYVDPNTGAPVETVTDPATGQLMQLDPATGQYVPATAVSASQPIQTGQMVDPTTGAPVGQQIDPNTGMPVANGGGYLVDANGNQIDPATGLVVGQVVGGNQVVQPQTIDPATGFPLQAPAVDMGQAPLDPSTGLPMTLVVDPATGQQVWVPSAPAQQQMQPQQIQPQQIQPQQIQPPAALGQPVPIENERGQRTLMDMIFGGQQN